MKEPEFQALLARRSAWRWSLTGLLFVAYFCYAIGGLYFPEHYATALPGTAIPSGILVGLFLIVLSVVVSLVYVRVVGQLSSAVLQSNQ